MTITLNEAVARKVLGIVDAGLVHGMGSPEPGMLELALWFVYREKKCS